MNTIASFIKASRKRTGLSQEDLAYKAGVGLRLIRELETGKSTVRTDKVNNVLRLFGKQLGVVDLSINDDN